MPRQREISGREDKANRGASREPNLREPLATEGVKQPPLSRNGPCKEEHDGEAARATNHVERKATGSRPSPMTA